MKEEERWTIHGLDQDDPACIRTVEELEQYIEEVGFLPLFRCEIPGFSVEEHTAADSWWTDDSARDPWEWRKILAARGRVAYGKFFHRNAGFISKEWFPAFANYRRDGYDFDARWDDELASMKSKKIMDLFVEEQRDRELFSFEAKQLAGYGEAGEKNFEGEITNLQMQTYLCIRDFKRRKNKNGSEYGWGIAVYCTPEHLWGYDYVTSLYSEEPKESALRIFAHVKERYPEAEDRHLRRVLGIQNTGAPEEKKAVPYPDNLIKALRVEGLSAETMTGDQKAGLEVAVGQLRDKQQRTILMKYRDHMKNDEIGKSMNRAAGTVSTYHTKAMGKLRWPGISVWYLEGYDRTLQNYLRKKKIDYQAKGIRDDNEPVGGRDYCLRLGISLKQFDGLMAAGICTVFDLIAATQKPDWYRPIRGIGPKSAADIEKKLDQRYIQRQGRDEGMFDSFSGPFRGGHSMGRE